jgi:hypothetical protein
LLRANKSSAATGWLRPAVARKAFGNQWLIWLARIVLGQWQRSIVAAIASGWRATHCEVHAMIASRSWPGVRRPSHHKLHIRRGLGALRTSIST